MDDEGERVHGVAVQEDVELDELGGPEVGEVVVEGGVSLRERLQPIVEVDDDLGQGEVEGEVDAPADVLDRAVLAARVLGELVHRTHELGRHEDGPPDVRLLDLPDVADMLKLGRVVDLERLPADRHHAVAHRRGGGDEGEPELPLQALLDDLQVEEAEEPAPEAEAEGHGGLRLEGERGVVEAQLLQGVAEPVVLGVLQRIEPGEDHRLRLAEAGEGLGRRVLRLGDGLPDPRVGHPLDGGGDEADLARRQGLDPDHLGREDADLLDLEGLPARHEEDLRPRGDPPVQHADVDDDALVGVVERVEDESLERRLGISSGRRDALHDRLEDVRHAGSRLGADGEGLVGREAEEVDELADRPRDVGRHQLGTVAGKVQC